MLPCFDGVRFDPVPILGLDEGALDPFPAALKIGRLAGQAALHGKTQTLIHLTVNANFRDIADIGSPTFFAPSQTFILAAFADHSDIRTFAWVQKMSRKG